MFDDLSAMDWVFIVCALVLGFGVVKFMLSHAGAAAPVANAHDTPGDPAPRAGQDEAPANTDAAPRP
jgi:hypothetical protein